MSVWPAICGSKRLYIFTAFILQLNVYKKPKAQIWNPFSQYGTLKHMIMDTSHTASCGS